MLSTKMIPLMRVPIYNRFFSVAPKQRLSFGLAFRYNFTQRLNLNNFSNFGGIATIAPRLNFQYGHSQFKGYATESGASPAHKRFHRGSILIGLLAVIGGFTVAPVVIKAGVGLIVGGLCLLIGGVALAFSLGIAFILLSFGFIFGALFGIPAYYVWTDLKNVPRTGLQKSGWVVRPFEGRSIISSKNDETKYTTRVECDADFHFDPNPIMNKFQTTYYQICREVANHTEQETGLVSLEKDFGMVRFRIPISLDLGRQVKTTNIVI